MRTLQVSLFAAALVVAVVGFAQQQPTLVWERSFNFGGVVDNPISAVVANNFIFVNGWREDVLLNVNGVVSGFNGFGTQEWVARDSTMRSFSFAGHIALLGNDVAWFSGGSPNFTTASIARVNDAGNVRWRLPVAELTYLGPRDDTSFVAVPVGTNPLAFIYNANGVVVRQFPLVGTYQSITTVRGKGDDVWIFAHYPGGVAASRSYFVVRYRISTGQQLWRANFVDVIRGFGDIDPEGNAYVAGSKSVNDPGGLVKFAVARVNADGSLAWQREYFTKENPAANSNNWVNACAFVQAGSPGQVILAGAVERSDSANTGVQYSYAASFRATNGEDLWRIERRMGTFNQFNGCTSIPGGAFLLVENVSTGSGSLGYLHKYQAPTLSVKELPGLPESFRLAQNYPNPFNPTTTIEFSLLSRATVRLVVYDLLGREVATLVHETLESGVYETMWDATGMASGTYFYRLWTGTSMATRAMQLVR
jgi:hypothetical protein